MLDIFVAIPSSFLCFFSLFFFPPVFDFSPLKGKRDMLCDFEYQPFPLHQCRVAPVCLMYVRINVLWSIVLLPLHVLQLWS